MGVNMHCVNSEGRIPLLLHMYQNCTRQNTNKMYTSPNIQEKEQRSSPGIEPGTSSTQRRNHTTRPTRPATSKIYTLLVFTNCTHQVQTLTIIIPLLTLTARTQTFTDKHLKHNYHNHILATKCEK